MYIATWDEFQKAVEELYTASPEQTRYVQTYRHAQEELVLKVTNDRTLLQYKTNQASDLKKFINLNMRLMCQMQNQAISEAEDTEMRQTTAAPVPSGPQIPEVVASKPASGGKKNRKRKH
ncbi:signal recognition particle, SRP9/SRP14 subunit [Radiomyces spectabilis]|uniref:signal recognition particle, SRP9/SRP14 subunit n=1 Tax=Radiomyces spectabilis TaxID=64574 RepID=UPI002220AA7A|nr:signal recognition particle, SRP9/SRP14 subunit [Radiomyces spectabilis]KAI8373161.1 signal recognition particle, SRP9/SRP14 subunit [Radiomyces spectabilis]